jgi:hypothetical protein
MNDSSVPIEGPNEEERDDMSRDSESNKTGGTALALKVDMSFFADIASAAWKLRQRILDPTTGSPRDELRHFSRHVETILETLSRFGIEIQDHTNQPFNSGQSLEVLAFQPTPGVDRELVSETIRPSIYIKGRRIQIGQVIVSAPDVEDIAQ